MDSEDDLVFNENPFVRKLMRNNSVYYFRGLFMKAWANGPFQYQTQKVNECWTFTYGQGRMQLSDGQELIRVINFESDGKRDDEGFMTFKLPESSIEIIGEDVT